MNALVVGASGGIGLALAERLELDGARVTRLSRRADGLDLTDQASVERVVAGLGRVTFDRIVVATGILAVGDTPPERAFRELEPEVMARAFAVNAIGPALLLKHLGGSLPRDRPSVFAVLSARLASIEDNRLGGWMSYRASKAALNQVVRCAAIELGRKRPRAAIVALHPGTVPTALTERFARGRFTATPEACAAQLVGVMDALEPSQSGGFFAYDGTSIPW